MSEFVRELEGERDRYREALDLIIAEALHDTGEEDLADIARQALVGKPRRHPEQPYPPSHGALLCPVS